MHGTYQHATPTCHTHYSVLGPMHTTSGSLAFIQRLLLESNCLPASHYQGNIIENWRYLLIYCVDVCVSFCTLTFVFCVGLEVDPVPNFTKQSPQVYRSLPVSSNCSML